MAHPFVPPVTASIVSRALAAFIALAGAAAGAAQPDVGRGVL